MSETDNSLIFNLAAHFAKRNTKFGGGGKARAWREFLPRRVAKRLLRGVSPHTPFSSRPARAVKFCARQDASVRSKKVRASSSNCDAGVTQWQCDSFPSYLCGFDSHHPLKKNRPRRSVLKSFQFL